MARQKSIKPDFLTLQRQQLDSEFKGRRSLKQRESEKQSWIKVIRTAIGMTTKQLGKRLQMTEQGVSDLERREANETITLGTLRKAANALNAELVVAVIPRESLEAMVHEQARSKAMDERNRVAHTMRLESQATGIDDVLDVRSSIERWTTKRIGKLWD